MFIGGPIASSILKRYEWRDPETAPAGYHGSSKLQTLFGPKIWDVVKGKTVIDFGSGKGREALEIARHAAHVIGLETLDRSRATANENLAASGLTNCEFAPTTSHKADIIFSIDSFEHFSDPAAILNIMAGLLKPDGKVMISFGPPWLHPKGCHMPLFSWAHVVLSEHALMTWRSQYKKDGAKHYHEVDGGLNRMTIAKFTRLVASSPLKMQTIETVPIHSLRWAHCRLTREFCTSTVRATLTKR
jgi:2-polyprenyl-3-methyl-5-hydroxy-6-metoxy-1,4-benzoquinol methylase